MSGDRQDPNQQHDFPDLSQIACTQIQKIVTGNGLQANQVRVTEHEQGVLELSGELKIRLTSDVTTETSSGHVSNGVEVASEAAFQQELQNSIEQSLADPQVQGRIVGILNEAPGQGWALDNEEIKLPENKKTFFYSDNCHDCDGKKMITCSACHGDGLIPCGKCLGDGYTPCAHCEGLGDTMLPDGSQTPCRYCKQTGRILCPHCKGKLNLVCNQCRGARQMPCNTCHQTGVMSVIKHINYTANTNFIFNQNNIDVSFHRPIEALNINKLLSANHAKLAQVDRFDDQDEKILKSVYTLHLPVAKSSFSLNGQAYPALVIGQNAVISEIEPFLDRLIKPGIGALQKISKGPMATDALIQQAGKFTIIKTVLNQINSQSKKRIYAQIKKDYPVGLSDKYAKACISFADKAIKKLTEKPRYIGCGAGLGISTLLMAGWYLGGFQKQILAKIPAQHHNLMDFVLLAGCWLITFFTIKFMAAQKIKKLMPQQMLDKGHMPTAGNLSYLAFFILSIVMGLLLFNAPIQPDWFKNLIQR